MGEGNELIICGERAALARLIELLEAPRDGWRRNRDAEESLRARAGGSADYCFSCSAQPGRPAAEVWFRPRYGCGYYIAPPRSPGTGPLPEPERGRILDAFRDYLAPAARAAGVEVREVFRSPPEQVLSREGLEKFRAFGSSVDRASPDPEYAPLWREFILQVYRDSTVFEPGVLERWLRDEGWPEPSSAKLIRQFRWGLALLWASEEEPS